MGDVANGIEKRLARYAEEYRSVLTVIQDQIGVDHSVLPEVKSLVESWLGVNSHRLSGQGSILADTKIALGIVGDLAPLFAGIAADLAMGFAGLAVPGIGLIVTGWRLYVREKNMQRDIAGKIVTEMRKQLRQVEGKQAATIRGKVSEGFESLRTRIIDNISQDIDSIDLSLQDIIERKQAKEYSVETDKQRMRDARDAILDEIQALDMADLTHVDKAMARIKQARKQRRSDPNAPDLGPHSESPMQRYCIETIAEFSTGLHGMILALESAHDEMNRLEIGRPLSLPQLEETIARLKEQKARGLRVAVFGSFSSGKSSLINALLGIDHLVVGTQATTASLTHIRKSTTGIETAIVHYKSVADFAMEIWEEVKNYHADLAAATGEECEVVFCAFDNLATLFSDRSGLRSSLEKRSAHRRSPRAVPAPCAAPRHGARNKLEPRTPIVNRSRQAGAKICDQQEFMSRTWLEQTLLPGLRDYFGRADKSGFFPPPERRADWQMTAAFIRLACELPPNILERLGQQETLTLTELKPVLAEEQTAVCVERVELCIKTALLEGDLEIVDTPGLGSLHARHTRQSEAFVKDVDAILYVLPDRGPCKEDHEFLALLERRNEVLNEDKVFFAANMVDKVIDGDAQFDGSTLLVEQGVAQHRNMISQDLKGFGFGFGSARVFAVSAQAARFARSALEAELSRKDQGAFRKVALWFGEAEEPSPEENLRLSGLPGLSEALVHFLIDNGVRLRVKESRARIVAILDTIGTQESARLQFLSREYEQLEAIGNELNAMQERIKNDYDGERSQTFRDVQEILLTLGEKPMQVEIKCVLDGIVGPIMDRWSKRGKDMSLAVQFYRFTAHAAQKVKNSTFGIGERSSLKIYIDKIVDESFRETVARNRTTEKLERIQKELSVSLSVAIRARLRRISDELNRIRMNNEIPISDDDLQFGAGAICDEILVSDIGETIT